MKNLLIILFCLITPIVYANENKSIDELINDLKSENCSIRDFAIEHLGILKDSKAIKPLEETYFSDKCHDNEYEIIYALRLINHPDAIDSLIRMSADSLYSSEVLALLNNIDPNWRQRPETKRAFEKYLDKLNDKKGNPFLTVKIMINIDPKQALKPLLTALQTSNKDEEEDIREAACKGLGVLKAKQALELLVEYFFDSKDSYELDPIYEALQQIDPNWQNLNIVKKKIPGLIQELEHAIKNNDNQQIMFILYKISPLYSKDTTTILEKAIPSLIKILHGNNEGLKRESLFHLSSSNKKEARLAIVNALMDGSASIREDAVRIIGHMGIKESCSPLISLLNDDFDYIKRAALDSISRLQCTSAREHVMKIAKDTKTEEFTRSSAISSLASIQDSTAGVQQSCILLTQVVKDHNYKVKEAALDSIGKLKCASAADSLIEILRNDSIEQSLICKVLDDLIAIGDSSVVPKLIDVLKSSNDSAIQAEIILTVDALIPFANIDNPEIFAAILTNPEIMKQDKLIDLLVRTKDKQVIPLLQKAAGSSNIRTKAYAEWAIWNLQNQ